MGPGSTLGGRYVLDTRVQQAPAFERWHATDETLEREVVVLCFPLRASADEAGAAEDTGDGRPDDRAAAALDAARRAAGVEDARLVRVLDVGRDGATAYVVEEPLGGARDLVDLVADGPLPGEEARRLVGEAAAGLEAARRRGLHHGALDPAGLLRMPDGRVKVRGLATQAALMGLDDLDASSASREDAVTLVALAHAALTGTWAGDHAARALHRGARGTDGTEGPPVALPPAPRSVSGVLAPSEVVTDVPADLDTIARLTLAEGQGPLTPGDLAGQIAPWSRSMVPSPVPGGRPARLELAGDDDREDGDAGGQEAAAAQDRRDRAPTPKRATTVLGMSLGRAAGETSASAVGPASADAADAAAAADRAGTAAGAEGVGATVAGAAVLDRGADDTGEQPVVPAARGRRRPGRERPDAPMRMTRDMRVSETLAESDEELESPLPMVRVPSQVGADHTGVVLAIVAAAVVLVAVLGIVGVSQIGSNGSPMAAATATSTATASARPTATPTPSATTTATGAPLQEVAIVQAQPWDPQGDGQEGNASAPRAFDKDPSTMWRSQTYQSAAFGGFSKTGIGLVLDLGQQTPVRQVTVTLVGGSDVSVYVASRESLDGATLVGSSSGKDGTLTFTPPSGSAEGQLVILWFTKLAPDGNGAYRAQVAEATVSR
ncbi:hypothetical protein [Lapillicoccus jejuensis]|uniref:hypothetical protein n=1 Tax=Lapillicoccus jejuensis TaxID=402171 RepID=UPI001B85DD23|nr:hypothetical protein [Lapillicoccus jejuensis]